MPSTQQGLLPAKHSVGPQTGQCRDPGATIADFERLVTQADPVIELQLQKAGVTLAYVLNAALEVM
jgi:hypothetical protein